MEIYLLLFFQHVYRNWIDYLQNLNTTSIDRNKRKAFKQSFNVFAYSMRNYEKYCIEYNTLCMLFISHVMYLGFFPRHAFQDLKGNFSKEKWNKLTKSTFSSLAFTFKNLKQMLMIALFLIYGKKVFP